MRRVNRGGRVIIEYLPGDRVKVPNMDGSGNHFSATVSPTCYWDKQDPEIIAVRVDGEQEHRQIPRGGIIKQADTGVFGRIEHLEQF